MIIIHLALNRKIGMWDCMHFKPIWIHHLHCITSQNVFFFAFLIVQALFLFFLSYFNSFTFVMIRNQRIFGIFCLFKIFRHSHGIFQLFFCFIYFFSGHLNPLMYQIHLYAFQRQQNTPHKYFFGWCYCYCCCYN